MTSRTVLAEVHPAGAVDGQRHDGHLGQHREVADTRLEWQRHTLVVRQPPLPSDSASAAPARSTARDRRVASSASAPSGWNGMPRPVQVMRWFRMPTDMSASRGPKMYSSRSRSGHQPARTNGSSQLGMVEADEVAARRRQPVRALDAHPDVDAETTLRPAGRRDTRRRRVPAGRNHWRMRVRSADPTLSGYPDARARWAGRDPAARRVAAPRWAARRTPAARSPR